MRRLSGLMLGFGLVLIVFCLSLGLFSAQNGQKGSFDILSVNNLSVLKSIAVGYPSAAENATLDVANWSRMQGIRVHTLIVDGNVGIGTTEPVTRLDINLSGTLEGRRKAFRIISTPQSYLDLETYVYYVDVGGGSKETHAAYHFSPNGIQGLVIRDTGEVGIGTNPNATLDVKGNIRANVTSGLITLTTPGGMPGIVFFNSTGGGRAQIRQLSALGGLSLGGSSADHLIITNTGNVGIGKTPDTAYKLDVAGKVNASGFCINGNCISSWPSAGVTGSGTKSYLTKWTGSSSLGNSKIYDDGSVHITSNANVSGDVYVSTGCIYGAGNAYRLCIQDDGNLVLYKNSDSKACWASKTPGKYNC